MITHRIVRASVRASAVGIALALPLLAAPAFADTPAAWPKDPHVSGLDFLIVLLLIPGGIALLIALLVSLPSLVKGDSYRPGEAWRGEDQWFGGPRKGVAAADAAEGDGPAAKRGGAGGDF